MNKGSCENESALLILLVVHLKKNITFHLKNLKGGGGGDHYEKKKNL